MAVLQGFLITCFIDVPGRYFMSKLNSLSIFIESSNHLCIFCFILVEENKCLAICHFCKLDFYQEYSNIAAISTYLNDNIFLFRMFVYLQNTQGVNSYYHCLVMIVRIYLILNQLRLHLCNSVISTFGL